jgi:hypothetical protein
MRAWSGRVPRPATGDGLGLQHQVVFVRWGGLPETRPMRGSIDGLLSAACMGVGRSLQACCATQVDRSATSWRILRDVGNSRAFLGSWL